MINKKIGIRPVIDGRWGGVRESLETQTMNGNTLLVLWQRNDGFGSDDHKGCMGL